MIKSNQTVILTCDCKNQAWIVEDVDEEDHVYSLTCSKCGYRVPEDLEYGDLIPGVWGHLKEDRKFKVTYLDYTHSNPDLHSVEIIDAKDVVEANNQAIKNAEKMGYNIRCSNIIEHFETKQNHLKRIEISKKAIMELRTQKKPVLSRRSSGESSRPDNLWGLEEHPLTYGAYGLLEYIKTGDVEKIMDRTIRRAVIEIIEKEEEENKNG